MAKKKQIGMPSDYKIPSADTVPVTEVAPLLTLNIEPPTDPRKFALIHIGTDEVYGLEYVAAEVKRHGHQIKWFDGDLPTAVEEVLAWEPDFLTFSPLTTFFPAALDFSCRVKAKNPAIRSVFGGHHVTAAPEVYDMDGIDIVAVGPVYGTIPAIVNSTKREVLKGYPVAMHMMTPSRKEYFDAVPAIGNRHRKTIMSHFGCPYNCSYCSISRVRTEYSWKEYRKFWLTRRPISHIIEEAKVFLDYPTKEVALEDDDMLYGSEIDEWLPAFAEAWKEHINLPIFGNVTPRTVVKVSDATLDTMAELVSVAQMGVQAARSESLKMFNRQFQDEEQVEQAVKRLAKHNIPVKLELIVGLPVDDPIGDAIDTLKLAQRIIVPSSFVVAFPLMLYPGTALYRWCVENEIPMRDDCTYEWYGGIGSILFDDETQRQLTNITKMAAFFVKYQVSERWMRALIKMDMNDPAAKALGEAIYYESLKFRMPELTEAKFDEILEATRFRW